MWDVNKNVLGAENVSTNPLVYLCGYDSGNDLDGIFFPGASRLSYSFSFNSHGERATRIQEELHECSSLHRPVIGFAVCRIGYL